MFLRPRSLFVILLLGWGIAGRPAPGQDQAQEITHQIFVRAITISVTVQDRSGRYINDLAREDFTVLENGRKKDITYFEHDFNAPLSLTVLLDVSGSMALEDKLADCRAALRTLVTNWLAPRDEAALLVFADGQVEVAAPHAVDKARFLAELDKAAGYGRTALNDAVAVSSEFADRGGGEKRAVLLLTDGIENDSRTTPDQALAIARRTDMPIYTIGYKVPLSERLLQAHKRKAGATPAGLIDDLRKFSEATGGKAFILDTLPRLKSALGEIRRELSQQYLLGYTSNKKPGENYRSLQVLTSHSRYRVRTRQGY
ncbi:MAG: VWA domain-containing protein [Acidobacteriota bacterium]|nr:VWA domain-containing protein [Acidobacteriota bacterium]